MTWSKYRMLEWWKGRYYATRDDVFAIEEGLLLQSAHRGTAAEEKLETEKGAPPTQLAQLK